MVREPSRGQLLLTTAVVLALIILGLTVLLNASVTTEIRSPDDPATDLAEADRLAQDIERGSTSLVVFQQNEGYYAERSALELAMNESFDVYGDILYETVGDRRATHVTLETITINQNGTYVADPDRETDLSPEESSGPTVLIDPNESAPLAALQLSLEVESLEDDPDDAFQVHFHGDDNISAIAIHAGDDDAVAISHDTYDIDGNASFTDSDEVSCEGDQYVDIDLTRYNRTDADCHVDLFASLEGDHFGLTFENPTSTKGGFHFVMGPGELGNETMFDAYDGDEPDGPFTAYAAWSVDLTISQLSQASDRHSSQEIEVYADPQASGSLEVPWA